MMEGRLRHHARLLTQIRPAFQLLGTEKLTAVYAPASHLTRDCGQSSENEERMMWAYPVAKSGVALPTLRSVNIYISTVKTLERLCDYGGILTAGLSRGCQMRSYMRCRAQLTKW